MDGSGGRGPLFGLAAIVLVAAGIAIAVVAGGDDDGGSDDSATAAAEPGLTLAQEQALYVAQGYIDSGGVSRAALIETLSLPSEGFSKADATFAAQNVEANWEEEALQGAQSRIEGARGFGYSRISLRRHLTLADGYPKADAILAVDRVDANWKEQAVQAAKGWLKSGGAATESELLESLESDGFTPEEAQYGVDKAY